MSNEAAEIGGILFSVATLAQTKGNQALMHQAVRVARAALDEVNGASDDPLIAAVLLLAEVPRDPVRIVQ